MPAYDIRTIRNGRHWKDVPFTERFWSYVLKTPECWVWRGPIGGTGYGAVRWDKRQVKAHRAAWILTYGAIPAGLWVLHHCDNRPCVRPDHLWLGTHQQNMADRNAKGRTARGERSGSRLHPERVARGEHSHNAKLSEPAVIEIRRLIADGLASRGSLAARYGVCLSTISAVVHRRIWAHV